MMTGVSEVPIVEVHAGNIIELWPSLVHAIRSSSFIAIDTVSQGSLHAKKRKSHYHGIAVIFTR